MLSLKDKICRTHGCVRKGQRVCPPAELELPILRRKSYGLDVVTWIGTQRSSGARSLPEIHAALENDFGVAISPRQVANLFKLFCALVHCVYADEGPLRKRLIAQGEIILTIDAVFFDSTSPGLVVLRDAISKNILYAERAIKRDTQTLRLLLRKVKGIGVPIRGVISDKEEVQVMAVEQELPGVPHQYCQTHFLANVVKGMESDIAALAEAASKTVIRVRQVQKELPDQARLLGSSQTELAVATKLCTAALTAGKVSGDPILNPAALKRLEKLETVTATAEEAARRVDQKGTAQFVRAMRDVEAAQDTETQHAASTPHQAPAPEVAIHGQKPKRRNKKEEVCPLLFTVLAVLLKVRAMAHLVSRLRRQVEIVKHVAHILKMRTDATQVKRVLSTYLNRELRQVAKLPSGDAFRAFVEHLDTIADRYWAGLFHCYDVPRLPATNNDLERDFGGIKRAERKATGRKSTSGGPLETCAEFVIETWEATQVLPELEGFLKDVTDEQLRAALQKMEALSEPARLKRRIQRDLDGFLSEVLEGWPEA